MKLSEISIKRPVFATMMIGALLVMGWFSYTTLPVEMFPEVDFPFVVVQTIYPGASAESVETEVSKKIEDVTNELSGVKRILTTSNEGYSLVFIEFELNVDGTVAAQDVREKIAKVRAELPDDIEDPLISQFDMGADPIISIALSGQRPLRDITEIAKNKIKTRLEIVSGVGNVQIVGGFDREILVALDPVKMEAHQVTVNDVSMAVTAANAEIPGGRIGEASQEYLVRLKGRLTKPNQFNNIIIKNVEGVPVYLSDIGRAVDTVAEQRSLSRYDGNPTIALNVIKKSGANVVEMAQAVRQAIVNLSEELPPDISLEIVRDDSHFIEDSIHEIKINIMWGTLLAVIVIFLFLLDSKPTIITGLAIPISIVSTFTLMKFLGFSINFMTLLGLSLSVGILIDDAIVVVENIYRHLSLGKSPIKAAYDATKEIGLAVSATTFTIIVVFLPVAFMEGIMGKFFYEFGITVAFAVLVSLFVAFTLTPMLSSRWFKAENNGETDKPKKISKIKRILGLWNKFFDLFNPIYKRLLAASLRLRWVVITVSIAIFVFSMYVASTIGMEWFEQADQGTLFVTIETPPGTNLDETSNRFKQVEDIVNQLPEVTNTFVNIGSGNRPVNEGVILFQLTYKDERDLSAKQLVDKVRSILKEIPGIKYSVTAEQAEGNAEKPIEISIRGDDREELTRISKAVEKIALNTLGSIDVDNSLVEGKPEIQIDINRELADDLGLSLLTIPMTVRTLVEGDVVTRYKEGDEEYDVRIRLDEPFRNSMEDIKRIYIESTKELPGIKTFLVPLGRVANMVKSTAIGEYRRYNRQNEVRVNLNVLSGYASGTIAQKILADANDQIELPPGFVIAAVGQEEMREESNQNIMQAMVLAIIFIYLLLASQYESFFDPISIMISLPLSLIGAFLGLKLFGSNFSIMAMIGIVMLMGLVTKNAILLIDFVKQQREKSVPRTEAILIAGPIRLRPILMTTFATVFGMLPLALGIGPGAEMRAPMARAAIGGVLSSTLLTLVVVPVVYTLVDDVVAFFRRIFGMKTRTQKEIDQELQIDQ